MSGTEAATQDYPTKLASPSDPVHTEPQPINETDNAIDTDIISRSSNEARRRLNDIEVNTPGSRHVLQLLTHRALTIPSLTYASIPLDPLNLSLGFRDISYAELLNAINHCTHYLSRVLPPARERYEVVAYLGPKDIRYPIIACAFAKLEKRFLFISSGATLAGQTHLVRETGCKIFLYGGSFRTQVQIVVQDIPNVFVTRLPEVGDLLTDKKADNWEWNKSWEVVRHTPWMILHSSGTTGNPKPIEFTHQMMCNLDAEALMADAGHDSICKHIPGRRWYSPLLTMHVSFCSFSNSFHSSFSNMAE
jgi:acyl-CoA synthetase (AMP-forming)/AMP-acid ligase II